jgi:hypothetical protein
MLGNLLASGVEWTVQILELFLVVYLLYRGLWKRHAGVLVYLLSLLTVDEVVRRYFFHRYGLNSLAYAYSYWLTDVLLALEAFGLICIFFRRACAPKLWRVLRLSLIGVFILVVAISYLSLSLHKDNLLHNFIYEFEQNLFFTCVVLNTLLYIMLQQIGSTDEQLGLLVCGMGIQFAGPTAGLALVHLNVAGQLAYVLLHDIAPLCTLGMLLIWMYAVRRVTTLQEPAYRASGHSGRVPALAGASLQGH